VTQKEAEPLIAEANDCLSKAMTSVISGEHVYSPGSETGWNIQASRSTEGI